MAFKIALEEAFEVPGDPIKDRANAAIFVAPEKTESYLRQITDITGERLRKSDQHNIGFTVLSHTVPGVQGIPDKAKAEARATEVNNWVAKQIEGHRDKFGAFATVSLHDPAQAARELTRAVRELGFLGVLINDFQHAGPDGETYLYLDQPQYDVFWKTLTELDVPLYIHPAAPSGRFYEQQYAQRRFLVGPPLSFANGVSLHLLGLIINGVFDRFPTAKVIVGHLGEHIPFDFWRINHWLEDVEKSLAASMGETVWKKTIYDYFKTNIWVTTSGNFSTPTLKYVLDYLGPERVLFSVDYPYETIEDAVTWWDKDQRIKEMLGEEGYKLVSSENSRKLLKLQGKQPPKADATLPPQPDQKKK